MSSDPQEPSFSIDTLLKGRPIGFRLSRLAIDATTAPPSDDKTPAEALASFSDALWDLLLDQASAQSDLASLKLAHLHLLYWVHEHTSVTLQEACQNLGGAFSGTRRLVKELVDRGLMVWRGDLEDGRIVRLSLSDAGVSVLSRMETVQRNYCRKLSNRLTSEEQEVFAHYLHYLLQIEDDALLSDEVHQPNR